MWPNFQAAMPGVNEFAAVGDLGASPDLHRAFDDVDAVVHLAARVHVMQDEAADPLGQFRRVNVVGTEALAFNAVKHGVRRFVFVSTAKVNGESTAGGSFSEESPADPKDPYAVSKWEAEESLRSISAKTGMEIVIVRPPLVYGAGVRANFLQLIRLVDQGIPLPLPDTKNQRSLLGVENLADFLVRGISHPGAANRTFMVNDGEDVSTHELVVRLARNLGRSIRFLPVPASVIRLVGKMVGKEAAVNRLLGSLVISSERARQTLSWAPPVSLDAGLAATTRWYLGSQKRPVQSGIFKRSCS
jgi:nucleoside-diphosphate-sugar epimerase